MAQRGTYGALVIAVLLHLFVACAVIFNWHFDKKLEPVALKAALVNADAAQSSLLEVSQPEPVLPKPAVEQPSPPEPALQTEPKSQPQQSIEEQKSVAAKRAQDLREKRQYEKEAEAKEQQQLVKQQQEAEKRRKLAEQKEQEQAEIEKKTEKLKAEKLAEEKKKQESAQVAAEKKRKQEMAQAAEQKRKQEAALANSIDSESIGNSKRLVVMYSQIIQSKVKKNWTRPPTAAEGLSIRLNVRLSAEGNVLSVEKENSSGDSAFDASAVNAVKKANSFPEITELPPEIFKAYFQSFNLNFRPDN